MGGTDSESEGAIARANDVWPPETGTKGRGNTGLNGFAEASHTPWANQRPFSRCQRPLNACCIQA